jgi:glycosyltransferase involved in cell wall biosynthesis
MAHALPIVSSDADGCREAIEDRVTGLLVPQRQVDRMATAIAQLLADRDQARSYGLAARQRFEERFSLEATVPPLLRTLFDGQMLEAPGDAPPDRVAVRERTATSG